jgi:hypothetical protein
MQIIQIISKYLEKHNIEHEAVYSDKKLPYITMRQPTNSAAYIYFQRDNTIRYIDYADGTNITLQIEDPNLLQKIIQALT